MFIKNKPQKAGLEKYKSNTALSLANLKFNGKELNTLWYESK